MRRVKETQLLAIHFKWCQGKETDIFCTAPVKTKILNADVKTAAACETCNQWDRKMFYGLDI
jgi:hypothetical protein